MRKTSIMGMTFVPINTATVSIVAGAAGWVDTDTSGTTGTSTARIFLVQGISAGAACLMGVRAHGEALEPQETTTVGTFLTHQDSSGHIDFKRNAAVNVDYKILGYLKPS